MQTYHWTSAFIGIAVAAIILWLVKRDHLHTRYAMWWVPLAIVIGVVGVFPPIIDGFAKVLGVHYPPVLVLILGLLLALIKILVMDIERSRNEIKLQRLAQRLGIVEGEMERLKRERNAPDR